MLAESSLYLGIAEEARAEAYRTLGRGGNSSFRAESLTDVLVGQMEVEFGTALAVQDQVQHPPEGADRIVHLSAPRGRLRGREASRVRSDQ